MILKRHQSILNVDTDRKQYLFLNGQLVTAADDIWMAKQHVLNTLVILGIEYKKSVYIYEDEEGNGHEVTEITA